MDGTAIEGHFPLWMPFTGPRLIPPAQPTWLIRLPEDTSRLSVVPNGKFFSILPASAKNPVVPTSGAVGQDQALRVRSGEG